MPEPQISDADQKQSLPVYDRYERLPCRRYLVCFLLLQPFAPLPTQPQQAHSILHISIPVPVPAQRLKAPKPVDTHKTNPYVQ